jgi:hypothetical protein
LQHVLERQVKPAARVLRVQPGLRVKPALRVKPVLRGLKVTQGQPDPVGRRVKPVLRGPQALRVLGEQPVGLASVDPKAKPVHKARAVYEAIRVAPRVPRVMSGLKEYRELKVRLGLRGRKVLREFREIPVARKAIRESKDQSVLRDPSESVVSKATLVPKGLTGPKVQPVLRDSSESVVSKATLVPKGLTGPKVQPVLRDSSESVVSKVTLARKVHKDRPV